MAECLCQWGGLILGHDEQIEVTAPFGADDWLRLVAASVPVMIWVLGPDGGGRFFNSRWLTFTGRPLDDELGQGWLGALHPDDGQELLTAYRARFDARETLEMEFRMRRADGEYRYVFCRALPLVDPDGLLACYIGGALDVTERHQLEAERTRLLSEANEANARLTALQELTAHLARLRKPAEVAEVVLGRGVAELGATTASLCLLSDDGEHLEVAAQVGYPEAVTGAWGRFPLDAPTPAGDAVRLGEGVFISSLAELDDRYPIFQGRPLVGDEAIAVLPMATADGGMLGAMVIGFARPQTFEPAGRRLLLAVASQAADALARTRSRVALEAARQEAESARKQLAYLADASSRLAASLDLAHTLATVADLSVPHLADRCGVYLLADGRVEARVLAPADPDVDLQALLERYPVDLDADSGVGRVLRTGEPEFFPVVDEEMLASGARSEEHHGFLRRIGFGAALIQPMRARGRQLGALALTNKTGRNMDAHERALADELAARAAVAIDNALLFARQADVARQLQRSLLPPALPAVAGLDLAAAYAPAGQGLEVGGDFYDCVAFGEGRWLLAVGDVKGKGIDAAALTGIARHTIRSAAFRGGGPASVLSHLNRVLVHHESERMGGSDDWQTNEPRFCTAVVAVLTRGLKGFQASIASGGHPLPMLRTADGRVTRAGRPGSLLGVHPNVEMPETTVDLAPGSILVCFTDGVSECHDGDRFLDEEGVAAVLATSDGSAAGVVRDIETAARRFAPGGIIRDDMAILVVRVPG